ncbi:general transcription factor 3C polypeptide 5 isoform X2 [Bombyx mori]|uniref:general transcription factor 3C polypeptide 5 isoform X2 n=1 Tax=Bombyx mori TaxID=7091 RepID=UPI002ED54EB7
MEQNNFSHSIAAVLFPGLVKNEDKAIECLGGIRQLSQAYTELNKKRLGLSYQPQNKLAKKIYGDCVNTAGVLLKVKVKKTINGSEVKREVISTTPLGQVRKIYKFESLCDFQYLPVSKEGAGSAPPQCILEQIMPSGVDTLQFLTEPGPQFIIPSSFSRFDKPLNLDYIEKKSILEKNTSLGQDDDIHRKRRLERGGQPTGLKFSLTEEFPKEPHEYHLNQKSERMSVYPELQRDYEAVKKIFEERPICSQNYIKYHTKIKLVLLKIIMPCLAFYMIDGPWRTMYIKFGYDPRKDPSSRRYQTLDFRVRHQAGLRSMVVHYKKSERIRNKRRKQPDESFGTEENVPEAVIYFRPDTMISQRQVYYQHALSDDDSNTDEDMNLGDTNEMVH